MRLFASQLGFHLPLSIFNKSLMLHLCSQTPGEAGWGCQPGPARQRDFCCMGQTDRYTESASTPYWSKCPLC